MEIRSCEKKDIKSICSIYNYYIEYTVITFEEALVSHEDMAHRVAYYTQQFPWLVCEVNGDVVGYAYATKWQQRSAYKNSVEVTVYLRHGKSGQGYGQSLYKALLQSLSGNCHAIVAGIALPNAGSIRLHEKFGFEKVAHFKEVGQKLGRWIDVGYWQKIMKSA
jgi:phosphinothricin acetyltransferase